MMSEPKGSIRVGTAGWAIPRTVSDAFPTDGTGLQRYAGRLPCAEINSSFYRSHRPDTWARWKETTPESFRFSVKLPKTVTHEARLVDCGDKVAAFLEEAGMLGEKLGALLAQFPPSLAFDAGVADGFFGDLRRRHPGPIACEPRHVTWFEPEADALLARHHVARVAADPARHPLAGKPGAWAGLAYWRLHGSPRMYYSTYDDAYLAALAEQLKASTVETWCIFDNTTSGAAAANALDLAHRVR